MIFIPRDFILGNEICEKANINISNISRIIKKMRDNNCENDFVEIGNCTFIWKYSQYIPQNIKEIIDTNEFTDFRDCTLKVNFKKEFNVKDFSKIGNEFKICGKTFIKYTPYFYKIVKNNIIFSVSKEELKQYIEDKSILGYILVSDNSYIAWY